jgi:hypothetical protein
LDLQWYSSEARVDDQGERSVTNADAGPHFKWTFIADIPNPAGEDFHLWACSLCGAVVPGTHERVHLRTHGIEISGKEGQS